MANRKFVEDLIGASFVDPHIPKHQYGPDYIIPTTENMTWIPDGAVQIKILKNEHPIYKPESIISFFRKAVKNSPSRTAITTQKNDELIKWSYLQYLNDVETIAKGFIKLGVMPYHGVSILGNNSPEWIISYLAAIFCGGISTGIYPTNSPDACYHVINDSSSNIILVENEMQLEKIQSIQNRLPNLKAIVQFNGQPNYDNVISWQELLQIGKSLPDEVLDKRIKGLAVNQCCNLVYTSGTTGNPKGVMLSHDNLINMTKTMCYELWKTPKFGAIVSYLPLSHIAGVAIDVIVNILTESTVHFAGPNALKGDLVNDLIKYKPTFFFGVPRVYEKLKLNLEIVEASLSPTKKSLLASARNQASSNLDKHEINSTILNEMKAAIGFERSQIFICGGAPTSTEVINFFRSYGITLTDGFGLSESSGAHISNIPQCYHVGSVGNVNDLKYYETKILDPDIDGSGEIMLRGRDVFMGYLKLEKMTKETIEKDKWLHSGDIGKIDKDGFLFITGQLIITAGGENISPILIENFVKKLLPVVSNCMLIGDKRKYLTMLLTLKTEVNPESMEPIDDLNVIAIQWCESVGSSAKKVSEILQTKDPNVMAGIQKGIDEYNKKFTISRAQKIQKWTILSQNFCFHNGTLGPTSKLKRQVASFDIPFQSFDIPFQCFDIPFQSTYVFLNKDSYKLIIICLTLNDNRPHLLPIFKFLNKIIHYSCQIVFHNTEEYHTTSAKTLGVTPTVDLECVRTKFWVVNSHFFNQQMFIHLLPYYSLQSNSS
uniref:long-chain-fatty-acid--CoA ligase n=1 Tax=Strigamia maritima TaxID=126957 RepID=T1J838_STRMM